jgi:hypothetical protein
MYSGSSNIRTLPDALRAARGQHLRVHGPDQRTRPSPRRLSTRRDPKRGHDARRNGDNRLPDHHQQTLNRTRTVLVTVIAVRRW